MLDLKVFRQYPQRSYSFCGYVIGMSCSEILHNNLVTSIYALGFCFLVIIALAVALIRVALADRRRLAEFDELLLTENFEDDED